MTEKELNVKRTPRKRKKKTTKMSPVILTGIVAALIVVAVIVFVLPSTYNKVFKNVTVSDIELAGLTQEESVALLSENFAELTPEIKVTANGITKEIDFNVIAQYDIEATAENAFKYGRNNVFSKFFAYYFGKKDIPFETIVNKEALVEELTAFQSYIEEGYTDTTFKIEDDILIVTAGKSGSSIEVEKLAERILEELKKGKNVDIEAEVTTKEFSGIDVEKLYTDVYSEPEDAYYDEESSKLIRHKLGYSFDKEKAKSILKDANEGEEYKIQLSVTYPNVTEETLTGKMFSDSLASYSTKYNPGETNRTYNMYLASSKVNGTVIAPGEVFSYNGVVGERTVAKGYRNAKIFENGRVVDGLAGGICQVSTTIYNAALYSNMEIVERKNHSFPVSYAPMGQDATVVMGSIDFRFRNNTGYPIKIVSSVSGGLCTVTILGTDKNHYKIEIQNSVTGTKARPVEYENDATLEPGEEKVKQSGSDGYSIASRRIVRKNGEVVKNESIPSSYYIPLKKIILRNEEAENSEEEPLEGESENPEQPSNGEIENPESNQGAEIPSEEQQPTTPSQENTATESTEPVVTPDVTVAPQDTQTSEITVTPSADVPETTPEADPNTGV